MNTAVYLNENCIRSLNCVKDVFCDEHGTKEFSKSNVCPACKYTAVIHQRALDVTWLHYFST